MSEELKKILYGLVDENLERVKEIILRTYDAGTIYPLNEFERVICKALQNRGIFSRKRYELTEKGIELARKLDSERMKKTQILF